MSRDLFIGLKANSFKTKQQLTDIYNQATKEVKPEEPKVSESLAEEAKKYKSADEFVKKYDPIQAELVTYPDGEKIVTINLFPKKAIKGKGITKNRLLDLMKGWKQKGYTRILPSRGIWTSEGEGFMDTLVRDGYLTENHEITDKI